MPVCPVPVASCPVSLSKFHQATRAASRPVNFRVRKRRYERGLTQEQLAAQLTVKGFAITRGTLSKIEAQVRCVTDAEALGLAKAAKIPLTALFPAH